MPRPLTLGVLIFVCGAPIVAASCSVRIGSKHEDGTLSDVPSACARFQSEKKLPFGSGTGAIAFAWDRDHYVVVYDDPSAGDGDVYVARLDAGGDLQGAPAVVEATPDASDLPNLVKTQSGFLVVWQEGSAGKAVRAHALDADARPVGSGATIAATQAQEARPVLSRAPGGRIAVAWMDSIAGKGGVQVAIVDPATLRVTGPARIAPNDDDGWPWIAGDDGALAIAWSDKSATAYDVRFASIDPATLAATHDESLRGDAPHDGLLPRLARTPFGFVAAWEDMRGSDNQIFMSFLDGAGNALGGGLVEEPGSGDANWPNVAWAGAAGAIVYYQWRDARPQVFMSFVDATGARVRGLRDLQVSSGTSGWSKFPDVVWTGSEFGVVWVDTRDGTPAPWFARVACVE